MKDKVEKHFRILKEGGPGDRFKNYVRHFPHSKNWLVRLVKILVGLVVFVFGIALIFLPGPAFIFIPLGLLIIVSQIPFVAHWLDNLEAKLNKKNGKT